MKLLDNSKAVNRI